MNPNEPEPKSADLPDGLKPNAHHDFVGDYMGACSTCGHHFRGTKSETKRKLCWSCLNGIEAVASPASPAKEVCLDPSCPVRVTHYEREAPKCSAKEATREGTPETDAFDKTCRNHGETVEFARKLELSRNAAERRAADAVASLIELEQSKNTAVNKWVERLAAAESERDALRKGMEIIAKQMLPSEMDDEQCGDYEFGYAAIVNIAREALAPASETTTAESCPDTSR